MSFLQRSNSFGISRTRIPSSSVECRMSVPQQSSPRKITHVVQSLPESNRSPGRFLGPHSRDSVNVVRDVNLAAISSTRCSWSSSLIVRPRRSDLRSQWRRSGSINRICQKSLSAFLKGPRGKSAQHSSSLGVSELVGTLPMLEEHSRLPPGVGRSHAPYFLLDPR